MGQFDKGVPYYTVCNLDINVNFPMDEVKCKWCPFMTHYDGLNRDKCSLTSEVLFTREFTGQRCPLTILNTTETEDMR